MKCTKHKENYILSFNTFSKKYYECDFIDFSCDSSDSCDSYEKCIFVQNKTIDERYMLMYGLLLLFLSYFYAPLAILSTIFICIDYVDYYRNSQFIENIHINIEEFNKLKNTHRKYFF
jgi:hypothetical protein